MKAATPLDIERLNEREADLPVHTKGTTDILYNSDGSPRSDEWWDKRLKEDK